MPTLQAVRASPWLRAFYEGLRARGKAGKVAKQRRPWRPFAQWAGDRRTGRHVKAAAAEGGGASASLDPGRLVWPTPLFRFTPIMVSMASPPLRLHCQFLDQP
jgi:hypothetical protein